MSDQTIQDVLRGVERVHDMNVGTDSHHYIVLSLLYRWMRDVAVPVARGVLLDFGCGGQPYRSLLEPKLERYLGADIAPAAGVTLDLTFTPGATVPLSDGSIDTILSTQVLEHVEDPDFYLRECRRMLSACGALIITVPMQWRHHEVPYDYLRFTRYGITSMLDRNGFRIEAIEACGGPYALIGQIIANTLAEQGKRSKVWFRLVNRLALALDRRFPDSNDTILWMSVARPVELGT